MLVMLLIGQVDTLLGVAVGPTDVGHTPRLFNYYCKLQVGSAWGINRTGTTPHNKKEKLASPSSFVFSPSFVSLPATHTGLFTSKEVN